MNTLYISLTPCNKTKIKLSCDTKTTPKVYPPFLPHPQPAPPICSPGDSILLADTFFPQLCNHANGRLSVDGGGKRLGGVVQGVEIVWGTTQEAKKKCFGKQVLFGFPGKQPRPALSRWSFFVCPVFVYPSRPFVADYALGVAMLPQV